MSGAFHGISIASNALRAFQRELDVTGNNLANVDTQGYTRQRVQLNSHQPSLEGNYYVGNGVKIEGVSRIRDSFLDARNWQAQAGLGNAEAQRSAMTQIEGLFNEPTDSGISAALDSFFNSFSGLSSNPNDSGKRVEVQLSGKTLAFRIRQGYKDLSDLKSQLQSSVDTTIKQVQDLSQKVADLNKQIRAASATGGTPNDLADQRDQAISDLSALVDISTHTFSDGTVSVNLNQQPLVQGTDAYKVPTSYNSATMQLTGGTVPVDVRSGKLAGLLSSMQNVNSYMSNLDNMANTLRTAINGPHATGTSPSGATGLNFFKDVTSGPQNGAIDFDLDTAVAADPNNIASGLGKAGDGSIALALSKVRDTTQTALGGKTIGNYYANMASSIGQTSSFYKNSYDTQKAVLDQVQAQISGTSGVNLDEEMTNLLRFQRSYQASAKALTTFDQVTEELLNIIR